MVSMLHKLVTTSRYLAPRTSTRFVKNIYCRWMGNFTSTDDRPTPLPMDPAWIKKFNAAMGDLDPKVQARLAKTMEINYRSGVGKLINLGDDDVLP